MIRRAESFTGHTWLTTSTQQSETACSGSKTTKPTSNNGNFAYFHLPALPVRSDRNTLSVVEDKLENQFIVMGTDFQSKFKKAIPTARITCTVAVTILVDHRISNFCNKSTTITENGPQFRSKSFRSLFVERCITSLTTTEYRPQKDEQVERYKGVIASDVCHYVAGQQQDWDSLVTLLA